ncbi:MAG: lysophospholipid acyltransferase family protein [Gemmatimonadaceae bacterium]
MTEDVEVLSWGSRAALLLGRGFLQILGHTWRLRVVKGERVTKLREGGNPFIFSIWHGQLLVGLWHHRHEGVTVLISEHRDGEMVARAAQSLGYGLIRGSTTRGGGRALISLVRELRDGHEIAITPDGPRGPAGKFAPGALVAAQRSDVFILPVGVSASRSWRLRSWDRLMIPKPFARVTIAYGPPTKVDATDTRVAADEAPRFEALMGDAVGLAGG